MKKTIDQIENHKSDSKKVRFIKSSEQVQVEEKYKSDSERLQLSINKMPIAYILWDKNKNTLEWNEAAEKMFGYSREEMIGKPFFKSVVDKNVLHLVENVADELLKGIPSSYSEKNNNIRKDGTNITCLWYNTPIHDSEGKVSHVLSMAQDISKNLETEEAFRTSEERFRTQMIQSPLILEIYNLEGLQIEVNKAYEELWGFPASTTVNKFNVLKSKEVKETGLMKYVKMAYAGESVTVPEYEFNPTGKTESDGFGRVRWLSTKIYPLRDASNDVINIVISHEDITDKKQNERALKITNDILKLERSALEDKNIALKELIAEIEDEKNKTKSHIKTNFERTVVPLLDKMSAIADSEMIKYIELLKTNMTEITSPFLNKLENKFELLSPREIEVCNMIKNGLSTKDIAATLHTSIYTVNNQRQKIRQKLKISGSNNNLVSFLQTIK